MAKFLTQEEMDSLLSVCDDTLELEIDKIKTLSKTLRNAKVSGNLDNVIVEVPQETVNEIIDNLSILEHILLKSNN